MKRYQPRVQACPHRSNSYPSGCFCWNCHWRCNQLFRTS